jgi:hypothetical protein
MVISNVKVKGSYCSVLEERGKIKDLHDERKEFLPNEKNIKSNNK